jgi:hypothetical protein
LRILLSSVYELLTLADIDLSIFEMFNHAALEVVGGIFLLVAVDAIYRGALYVNGVGDLRLAYIVNYGDSIFAGLAICQGVGSVGDQLAVDLLAVAIEVVAKDFKAGGAVGAGSFLK